MSLYSSLAEAYDELFPLSAASVAFLESIAAASRPGRPRALDAGCATGSLALALAERGWTVLGIEPEASMVEIARRKAELGARGGARFVQGDMLDAQGLAGAEPYDLVLCLGNTLPHLGPEEARRFFGIARGLLGPEGSLVLQLLNYSRADVGPGFAFPDIEAGGLRFKRRYEASTREGRLRFVAELAASDRPGAGAPGEEEPGGELLLSRLRPEWIAEALEEAGFEPPRFASGWEGGPFDARRDLYSIVVAKPRAAA